MPRPRGRERRCEAGPHGPPARQGRRALPDRGPDRAGPHVARLPGHARGPRHHGRGQDPAAARRGQPRARREVRDRGPRDREDRQRERAEDLRRRVARGRSTTS